MLNDFVYITFLKWQNYERKEYYLLPGVRTRKLGEGMKELVLSVKGQQYRSLWWWNCLVSWLCQCYYPGRDIPLKFWGCHHWENLSRWHIGFFLLFFLMSAWEYTIISKFFKMLKEKPCIILADQWRLYGL